jgi:hypothetical protein
MGNFIGEVTAPVITNSDGNYEIAPGDLLVYVSNLDVAQPPAGITHGASEAADQQAVHDKFWEWPKPRRMPTATRRKFALR